MRYLLLALTLASAPAFAGNYALVNNGTVVNVIEWDGASPYMPPSGDTVVPLPGNSGIGWTYASGTFSAPTPAAPSIADQYAQVLASGVVVACASGAMVCTSAMAGTYTIPAATGAQSNIAAQANLNAIQTGINTPNVGLPGGGSTVSYYDMNGNAHTFTAVQFTEFSAAMLGYSYQLQSAYLSAQKSGTFTAPSNIISLQ
ncbi:hypothetical protein PQR71_40210 [Paraburkholderia fungorum]|uniref:hypothetical protein n=1 Tax=Paraburkholderia fungorum TaxID=134537 RepID=UPI0038BBB559